MNRLDHLVKASDWIGQAIANLDLIGEVDLAKRLRESERQLLDLEDAEPCGDPDPYLTALEAN